MPRGGKRTGAGRKRNETKAQPQTPEQTRVQEEGRAFAKEVLAHISDGCPDDVESPVDFQLQLLYAKDSGTRSYNFNRILDRAYDSPAQIRRFVNDKALEVNVNVQLSEIIREVRERKREYEASRPRLTHDLLKAKK